MNKKWDDITREDVIEAIQRFDSENENVPQAKTTFLEYNEKYYPAKHIRGMAYNVAYHEEISKHEYSGGMETVRFFRSLGFSIKYQGGIIGPISNSKTESSQPKVPSTVESARPCIEAISSSDILKSPSRIRITSKDVVQQKNSLQKLLNQTFGIDMLSEVALPWMTTPSSADPLYKKVIDEISAYRGNATFCKKNVHLKCDFVCQSQKLIFEYDERQHFSWARKLSLLAYKDTVQLCYDADLWVKACQDINAKDNEPYNRDEIRAFYDSVRDIESIRHGFRLIRIMHGAFDWSSQSAENALMALINNESVVHSNRNNCEFSSQQQANSVRKPLKVALYLQDINELSLCKEASFLRFIKPVEAEKPDIFVFPEFCQTPIMTQIGRYDIEKPGGYLKALSEVRRLSHLMGYPVIYNNVDSKGVIYSIYVNPFATKDETADCLYIKHTFTDVSAFDFDYQHRLASAFPIIKLKGYRIGMTICADCNHALFSRAYGKQNVDIIVNSTGGNVVHGKWHRYIKARAIENKCFSLCTMGFDINASNSSYTFAFTPSGKALPYTKCIGKKNAGNIPNNVYIYEIDYYKDGSEADISLDQPETISKQQDMCIEPKNLTNILKMATRIDENLYTFSFLGQTLILLIVKENMIFEPEYICSRLYSASLGSFDNKKYVLINTWQDLNWDFYCNSLSDILKTRAAENYITVLLMTPLITKCFQPGFTRNVQAIMPSPNGYMIDFKRMGGPEVVWRNNLGWRRGYEMLIEQLMLGYDFDPKKRC